MGSGVSVALAVVVLGEDAAVGCDQDRAERLVAGVQRGSRQFDAPSQVRRVVSIHVRALPSGRYLVASYQDPTASVRNQPNRANTVTPNSEGDDDRGEELRGLHLGLIATDQGADARVALSEEEVRHDGSYDGEPRRDPHAGEYGGHRGGQLAAATLLAGARRMVSPPATSS